MANSKHKRLAEVERQLGVKIENGTPQLDAYNQIPVKARKEAITIYQAMYPNAGLFSVFDIVAAMFPNEAEVCRQQNRKIAEELLAEWRSGAAPTERPFRGIIEPFEPGKQTSLEEVDQAVRFVCRNLPEVDPETVLQLAGGQAILLIESQSMSE